MTYRIRRYIDRYKRYFYFAALDKYKVPHWVENINDSNIYFEEDEAKLDIKNYHLKGVEVYGEE